MDGSCNLTVLTTGISFLAPSCRTSQSSGTALPRLLYRATCCSHCLPDLTINVHRVNKQVDESLVINSCLSDPQLVGVINQPAAVVAIFQGPDCHRGVSVCVCRQGRLGDGAGRCCVGKSKLLLQCRAAESCIFPGHKRQRSPNDDC